MSGQGREEGVGRRFSTAARSYDEGAQVQVACARRLLDLLEGMDDPAAVLEVGCGTGQLTRLLLRRFPRASVTALDLAPGMVREARRRLGAPERVRWIVADARHAVVGHPQSLVMANSSLHWLEPLEASLVQLARQLAPGGRLVASVMLDGTLRELHEARRLAAPHKIPRGRLPHPDGLRAGVEAAGLSVESFTVEEIGLTVSSPKVLLEALHRQGVTGGAVSRGSLPLHRGDLRRLAEVYRERFAVEGGVRVTYRVAYVRARRKGPGPLSISGES